MQTLIVVPTYNESENIRPLVESVLKRAPETHILIVDDNSPDGTGKIADALDQENPGVHVLHRQEKKGLGAAYVAGFRWALERDYECVVEMDADFSHHPQYVPKMIEHLRDHDFVIGSRYVKGGGTVNWGLFRKILSRGGSFYARMILGVNVSDFTGGFNGWHRKVLEAIQLDTIRSDGYSFQIELKHRACLMGFRFKEFPIIFEDRKVGQSKMSRRIIFEALRKVWGFRFQAAQLKNSQLSALRSSWIEKP